MQIHNKITRLSLAMGLVLLLGCASEVKNRYMIAPAQFLSPSNNAQAFNQQMIALRQLRLPDYLREQKIVYRAQGQSVIADKNELWAQDLEDNMKRVLQQNIASLLPQTGVNSYPLGADVRPDKIVDLQVIEMIADKEVLRFDVLVSWQVFTAGQTKPQQHEFRKNYSLTQMDGQEIVRAYQQSLKELSEKIVATL